MNRSARPADVAGTVTWTGSLCSRRSRARSTVTRLRSLHAGGPRRARLPSRPPDVAERALDDVHVLGRSRSPRSGCRRGPARRWRGSATRATTSPASEPSPTSTANAPARPRHPAGARARSSVRTTSAGARPTTGMPASAPSEPGARGRDGEVAERAGAADVAARPRTSGSWVCACSQSVARARGERAVEPARPSRRARRRPTTCPQGPSRRPRRRVASRSSCHRRTARPARRARRAPRAGRPRATDSRAGTATVNGTEIGVGADRPDGLSVTMIGSVRRRRPARRRSARGPAAPSARAAMVVMVQSTTVRGRPRGLRQLAAPVAADLLPADPGGSVTSTAATRSPRSRRRCAAGSVQRRRALGSAAPGRPARDRSVRRAGAGATCTGIGAAWKSRSPPDHVQCDLAVGTARSPRTTDDPQHQAAVVLGGRTSRVQLRRRRLRAAGAHPAEVGGRSEAPDHALAWSP